MTTRNPEAQSKGTYAATIFSGRVLSAISGGNPPAYPGDVKLVTKPSLDKQEGSAVSPQARTFSDYELVSKEPGVNSNASDTKECQEPPMSRLILGKRSPARRGTSLPPQLRLNMIMTATRRFYAEAGLTSATITSDNILGAFGGIATGSSTLVPWFAGVRVRKLEIWTNVATSSSSASPVVYWVNSETYVKPEVPDRSVPAGATITSSLVFLPPEKALSGFWLPAGVAESLFVIKNVGIGSIIDLTCEVALGDGLSSGLVPITTSAATSGKAYYLKLDGSGGVLYPVSLPTLP